MRLVLGTQSYNYLVRLGLPLPPQIAIDDHITKMEKEVEDETNVVNEGNNYFNCHFREILSNFVFVISIAFIMYTNFSRRPGVGTANN